MILQVQDYFFFQTGALDGIAVRQAGKPYRQVEKQGIELFGTGCLRNLRCRCKTFQIVQMLKKTIRVGRNINAGFSQTENRKQACLVCGASTAICPGRNTARVPSVKNSPLPETP